MWRKKSSGERDILYLAQDVRSDVWTERFGRDQFDPPAKHFLQQQRHAEKIVKRLMSGLKLHQDIDIAIAALLLTHK